MEDNLPYSKNLDDNLDMRMRSDPLAYHLQNNTTTESNNNYQQVRILTREPFHKSMCEFELIMSNILSCIHTYILCLVHCVGST